MAEGLAVTDQPLSEKERRIVAATDELKAAIREAHELIRTLRLVMREAHDIEDDWANGVRGVVDETMYAAISKGLEDFAAGTAKATQQAYDRVNGEFDKIKNLLLYGNETGRGSHFVEAWIRKAIRDEIRAMTGEP